MKDCILTCHWHHARFDLTSGGTLDPWADDVRAMPVEVRDEEIWVDLAEYEDAAAHHRMRIREGLEQNLRLVLAKAVVFLDDHGDDPSGALREGLQFGTRYRRQGWGQGLTMLTCLANLLPHLEDSDCPKALYQGLSAVARECQGSAPRFGLRPLPNETSDIGRLKRSSSESIGIGDSGGDRDIRAALIGSSCRPDKGA